MRRFIGIFALFALASLSLAQSFTIRRPVEGSKVRENVPIRIPKGSIPLGSYVGIIINGKFLEATLPNVEGEDYVYYLDSKGRHIPDGDMDIEVVLYMDFNDKAEIVNRSSVKVKLDNYTSIKVPDEGYSFGYKFTKGKEYTYKQSRIQTVGVVSQAQLALGSRAGEIPLPVEELRMLYAIDNTYSGPDGKEALLRMQVLPEKGKNYAMFTFLGSEAPKKFYDFEMAPIYMKISPTGRELWGSIPVYFPLEGTTGDASRSDLYAIFPLPVLPSKAIYPGDTWQAQHLFSAIDENKLHEQDKLTEALASRGTFVGVEWERGMPCAKFNIAVDAGPRDIANAVNLNNQPGEAQKVSLNGVIWFSLDKGIIVKSDITMLQESLVTFGADSGVTTGAPTGRSINGPGAPPGGAASDGGGIGDGPARGRRAPIGAGASFRPEDFVFKPFADDRGQVWFFQNRGRAGGVGDDAGFGGGGGTQGPGFGVRTGGGSTGVTQQILRIRLRILTELEN